MAVYEVGQFIRRQREARNLTQGQLAEGICDQATLSRIENGDRSPRRSQLERIFQKLGLSSEHLFDSFLSEKEYGCFIERDELKQCIRRGNFKQAEKMIEKLEKEDVFLEYVGMQFLLSSKARVKDELYSDKNGALDCLNAAILISFPAFDESKINTYLLTFDEITIINRIAMIYESLGEIDRAINVLYKLRESIENVYVDEIEKARTYPMVINNLARLLGGPKIGKHDEALEICEIAIELCKRQNTYEVLPNLIFTKACVFYALGNTESCIELFTQAYYTFKITGKLKFAQIIKNQLETNYGIILPF